MNNAESTRANFAGSVQPSSPWSVDRWGRLLTGTLILAFTLLGLFHHPAWLYVTAGVSASLIATSLTDRCLVRRMLLTLGAKEREDLFLPGGAVRRFECESPSEINRTR